MKTLVIHPKDSTTDFLQPVYESIKNKKVIKSGTVEKVREEIEKHDRIIMLGHGTPSGLMAVSQFMTSPYCVMTPPHKRSYSALYVIDRNTVPLLRNKECIFIWCNADKFVEEHDLKGLYSGMFISEIYEATAYKIGTTQKEVDASNDLFAETMGDVINKPLSDVYEHLMPRYGKLIETNPIAEFNYNRLYIKS